MMNISDGVLGLLSLFYSFLPSLAASQLLSWVSVFQHFFHAGIFGTIWFCVIDPFVYHIILAVQNTCIRSVA